jgi:hypothetical protein
MLALVALVAFILSPFIDGLGPWPLTTVGFIFLTLHLIWYVGVPFLRPAPRP